MLILLLCIGNFHNIIQKKRQSTKNIDLPPFRKEFDEKIVLRICTGMNLTKK